MGWEWRRGNLVYLHFPDWEEQGIEIGFSSRIGGVSQQPYSSLNLGMHVGDNPDAVIENRNRWLSAWRVDWRDVAVGEQVHGTRVIWLDDAPLTVLPKPAETENNLASLNSAKGQWTTIPGVDGLLTQSSLGLIGFFADCVPLFFYESVIGAVALAHAGWRGTAGKIALRILGGFAERGGRPENVRVAVGPSIGPCCYEIDDKVAEQFITNFLQVPFLSPSCPGHYFLDLWQANIQILIGAGVPAEQIYPAGLCTSCHPEEFFSYRRDGKITGRMAGWIRRSAEGR